VPSPSPLEIFYIPPLILCSASRSTPAPFPFWQRDATRDLATGRTGDAISAYDRHDLVHEAQTRELARGDLIDRWDRDRQAAPDSSRIILTHTNAEVRELNEAARDRMREAGDLGEDMRVTVERGERSFAAGDRVMFLPDGTSSINRSPCPSNQRSDETDFHFPFDPPLGRHFKTAPRA